MGLCSVSHRVRAAFVRSVHGYLSPCFHSVRRAALKSNETHGAKSNGFLNFLLWGKTREKEGLTERDRTDATPLCLVGPVIVSSPAPRASLSPL